MFGATKFVVAGVIVALFGGFLLSGVLTQPDDERLPAAVSSPSTEPDAYEVASPTAETTKAPESTTTDPLAGTFSPAGSLALARVGLTLTLLPDGRVLVVGGNGRPTSAEFWDPETASFTSVGSLAKGRSHHTATLLSDGRVLIVGGRRSNGAKMSGLALAEVWDPETASFGPAGYLAKGRSNHTALPLPDGRVLIVGGDGGNGRGLSKAEFWDPETASFTSAGSLAKGRSYPSFTLLPDGRVLVVGGANTGGVNRGTVLASAPLWAPTESAVGPAGGLAEARMYHTASLLPDGRVLVVGGGGDGTGDDETLASAEVWDPETASFTSAGTLAEARLAHTATLLADGRVLVIGGVSYVDLQPIALAEVWEPNDG